MVNEIIFMIKEKIVDYDHFNLVWYKFTFETNKQLEIINKAMALYEVSKENGFVLNDTFHFLLNSLPERLIKMRRV